MLSSGGSRSERAALNTNLGLAYRRQGALIEAANYFQSAISLYQSIYTEKNELQWGQTLTAALIEQGTIYNQLGKLEEAQETLAIALKLIKKSGDLKAKAYAYNALGNTLLIKGQYQKAIDLFEVALVLSSDSDLNSLLIATLNNLSNAHYRFSQQYLLEADLAAQEYAQSEQQRLEYLASQEKDLALSLARKAISASDQRSSLSSAQANINFMRLSGEERQENVRQILALLPDSSQKVELLLSLAKLQSNPIDAFSTLQQAISLATTLNNAKARARSLTALGHLYEQAGQYQDALKLTELAQFIAQSDPLMAGESFYLASVQAGRIYETKGQTEKAIAAYQQAVSALSNYSNNLSVAPAPLQLNFRTQIQPVYQQLLAWLINNQENSLSETLKIASQLQVRELENYFRDLCNPKLSELDSTLASLQKTNAALIRAVILPKQSYLIALFPDRTSRIYPIETTTSDLKEKILAWRKLLENWNLPQGYEPLSQNLYDLLIRPLEPKLKAIQPSTLVFVGDSFLRLVPLGALSDGDKFLIEKYPLAYSLGFSLAKDNQAEKASESLIFGLSGSFGNFPPIPWAETEVENVQNILGGKKFVNDDFTVESLDKTLRGNFSVVHLATHAQFKGNSENSFLQTSNGSISLAKFEEILVATRDLELLTLSACETAAGNELSALGLSGIGLRSGARSVIGSLWFAKDSEIVPIISDFYEQWQQKGLSKAEALQKAQIRALKAEKSHPLVWSSLLLLGDWL